MSEAKPNVPKLRFPGFTGPWEQRKLGELVTFQRGLTYSPDAVADKDSGIRVLRSSNIAEDTLVLDDESDVFVRPEAVNIPLAQSGDILITAANGSSRLVGKRAILQDLTGKTVHGGFMLLAKAKDPDYLNAAMGADWYAKFLRYGVAGGNGALGNLDKTALEKCPTPIPSTAAEQHAIGALFRDLDDLITLRQRELLL